MLLLGVGQFFLLHLIYNLLARNNLVAAVGSGIVLVIFVILAFGVNFRQSWAHLIAIYFLVGVILVTLLRWVLPADLAVLGIADLDPAIQEFVQPRPSGLG